MDRKASGFKQGDECPFCDGELYLTGEKDRDSGKEVFMCTNDDCFFNQVQFN